MKINIIIAKKDRESHLGACLHFLNESAKHQVNDIKVYVVDEYTSESNTNLPAPNYSHISVHRVKVPSTSDLFNKSCLLNIGLIVMRQQYDWVAIVDVDMVHRETFFTKINTLISDKYQTCVCKGFSLDSFHSSILLNGRMVLPDPELTLRYNGNSQIILTKYAVDLIQDIYGELYCEKFKGWGGEDSDMSFRLKDLSKVGLIAQQRVEGVWYHLWHEPRRDVNDRNKRLFDKRRISNLETLRRWLHANKHSDTNL